MALAVHPGADRRSAVVCDDDALDPRIEVLVKELIGRLVDKWTMLVLDVLAEQGTLRFTHLGEAVGPVSQKMLTQTPRGMERDGLVIRTVHPVVPPRVEYRLTELGFTLSGAFCGVWVWASENLAKVEDARVAFDTPDCPIDLAAGAIAPRHALPCTRHEPHLPWTSCPG